MFLRHCASRKRLLFEFLTLSNLFYDRPCVYKCATLLCKSYSALTMGKKSELTKEEKSEIVKSLSRGESTNDIAKKLQRDHRTIKGYVQNNQDGRKPSEEKSSRTLSSRALSRIKREVAKRPLATSKTIFEAVGLDNVPRSTRCRTLRRVAKVQKAKTRPPLKKIHREKRMEWAKQYLKADFSKVIFTDECRANLDGPDGWASGWISSGHAAPSRLRRQQGGGGVMFWAAIVDDELVGPFQVQDGVKVNSEGYCTVLTINFLPWWKRKSAKVRKTLVFMHDNAPSHASRYSQEWLASQGFKDDLLMNWPACSSDLNPIENLWSILKRTVYSDGKQYNSKDQLWKAIQGAAHSVGREVIRNLTKSVDQRLLTLIERKGGYIGH